jgi:phosphorylcholine metabolism protein LicD
MENTSNSILLNQNNQKFFSNDNGFGKYKPLAVELLKNTIVILEEFDIKYFLISGTLLGYVRHNDFIPWDDDIDLIVDSSIIKKLPLIYRKYHMNFVFVNRENFLIKLCSRNGINVNNRHISRYLINPRDNYKWPFVDLFIFEKTNINNQECIVFFEKIWNSKGFFPGKKVEFLGMQVMIPSIPEYFLQKNFGKDYMTTFKSSSYNHKEEIPIKSTKEIKIDNGVTK